MKFKIKDEQNKEKVVKLYLDESSFDDKILLNAIDENGEDWLLMIFKDGGYKRMWSIDEDIGINVDEEGRIKEL